MLTDKQRPQKTKLLKAISLALFTASLSANLAYAGDNSTVAYADVENPWVHYNSEHSSWTDYASHTFSIQSVGNYQINTPYYTKIRGNGIDVVGDWLSGSFYENRTNRERYVQRFYNDFNFNDFGDATGYWRNGSEVDYQAVQIMLYNNAGFTLNKAAVWVSRGSDEVLFYETGNDIILEELLDTMAILPPEFTKIRVGFKAQGEIDFLGGDDWKKCDWVNIDKISGISFRAEGLLYDKKCYKDTSGNQSVTMKAESVSLTDSITHQWTALPSVATNFSETNLFVSPPSINGTDPGVIRLQDDNVGGSQIKFREFPQTTTNNRNHTSAESVDVLALESGHYEFEDGTQVEVGQFTIESTQNGKFMTVEFDQAFTFPPFIFTTIQTNNGSDAVSLRINNRFGNYGKKKFEVALMEADSKANGGHLSETVSYFAIVPPLTHTIGGLGWGASLPGQIDTPSGKLDYQATMIKTKNYANTQYIFGESFQLQEDLSQDTEQDYQTPASDSMGDRFAVFQLGDVTLVQGQIITNPDNYVLRQN